MTEDPASRPVHMSSSEFRRLGHKMVDWIADYHDGVEEFPVMSSVAPGEIRAGLPESPPMKPQSLDTIFGELEARVLPGITHWQSPNFFGYFPANASYPAILGELASAGLGVQGMVWSTSPACTEVEQQMADWMVEATGLPDHFRWSNCGGGVITDSASSATLCALVAAKHRTPDSRPTAIYATRETHSSLQKGAVVAGLEDCVRLVETTSDGGMDPEALRSAMAGDVSEGVRPTMICLTAGTTSAMHFDPVDEVAEANADFGAWLHLDGAFAGSAAICPEHRWVISGIEHVDSYVFNPHKWLLTNFDCSLFWVRDKDSLSDPLSITPPYLEAKGNAEIATDLRDFQIPLGRRFRALKLWFVMRHYGVEGLRAHIRRHLKSAEWLVKEVQESDQWLLAEPYRLGLLCIAHRFGDQATAGAIARLNESGLAFVSPTTIDGASVMRISIGSTHTQQHHVKALWDWLSAFSPGASSTA